MHVQHPKLSACLAAGLLSLLTACDSEGYVGEWVAAPLAPTSDPQVASGMVEDAAEPETVPAAGSGAASGSVGPADACHMARETTLLEVTVLDPNAVVYNFADGAAFPRGRYQITYVDGCRRYDDTAGWTLHASLLASGLSPQGRGGCYLAMSNGQALEVAPGTTGVLVGEGVEPAGAYASYSECVAANKKLPPLDLMFAGGSLGIMNAGDSSANKTRGEDVAGRSPTYRLTRVDDCP
jgi:hypothetical protein